MKKEMTKKKRIILKKDEGGHVERKVKKAKVMTVMK
jgi:hypothetical protein